MMRRHRPPPAPPILLALAVLGAGCASTPPPARPPVLVPVECKEDVPDRPAMPTELLQPGVAPWVLLRAALSEIDRREAYEGKMRAALAACTAPLEGTP